MSSDFAPQGVLHDSTPSERIINSSWFIRLNDIDCDQTVGNLISCRKKYGGKATNLTILAKNGFNIPDSFVITTEAFSECMDHFLRNEKSLQNIQSIIENGEFPEDFLQQLRYLYEELENTSVAVRSSSTDEDSSKHSYAGLQLSVIDVQNFDTLLCAIKSVWASFYSAKRMLYPSQNAPNAALPKIAVIIQKFVPATCSGVIFTKDPTNPTTNTMLLNATLGLAKSVVEGERDVESYQIQRKSLGFEATNILPLSIKGQTTNIETPCIAKKQIQKLVKIAINIEKRFKTPQDIEFSFVDDELFILQARPITSFAKKYSPRVLYSNVNVGEALSGVCTPMTWSVGSSFAKLGFETAFGSLGLEIPANFNFVTTINGRIYLNISEFFSILSPVPLMSAQKLGRTAGISNIECFDFDIMNASSLYFLKNLPKTLFHTAWNQLKLPLASKFWARKFAQEKNEFLALPLHTYALHELRRTFERLNHIYMDCGTKMVQAYANFLISYVLVSTALPHVAGDHAKDLEAELYAGLKSVKSAQPGLELLKLAHFVQSKPELCKAFVNEDCFKSSDEFFSKIRCYDGSIEFIEQFDTYLKKWGLRTTQEAELAAPRWRENPTFLLQTIKGYLLNPQSQTPEMIQKTASQNRKRATSHAKHNFILGTEVLFKLALFWSHQNARLREEWRSYVVDTLGIIRYFLQECARRMLAAHCIAEESDVFFLSIQEVLAFLENDPEVLKNARQWIAYRRAQNYAFENAPRLPDTFVLHTASEFHESDNRQNNETSTTLYGLPASPGVVTGKARLMRDLANDVSTFQHGEIIVAESTDVGWTPLFLLASAVLAERGGPLSHSCVVAREYGIPAVVGIPNLMRQVKTGDLLTVYGNKGIVYIQPTHAET